MAPPDVDPLAHFSVRRKASSLEIDERLTRAPILFRLKDGNVPRRVVDLDRDCVLADLGVGGRLARHRTATVSMHA